MSIASLSQWCRSNNHQSSLTGPRRAVVPETLSLNTERARNHATLPRHVPKMASPRPNTPNWLALNMSVHLQESQSVDQYDLEETLIRINLRRVHAQPLRPHTTTCTPHPGI